MARGVHRSQEDNTMLFGENRNFNSEEIDAFRQRQDADYLRRQAESDVRCRKPFNKRYTNRGDDAQLLNISDSEDEELSNSGEEGWRNSEGERLGDFGVDEEVEFYDEDDIPLATLIQRRKLHSQ